jgi:hypothetical protein
MLVTNPHRLSFLVAEKSFNQRIVGDFARLVGSIPVARPQVYLCVYVCVCVHIRTISYAHLHMIFIYMYTSKLEYTHINTYIHVHVGYRSKGARDRSVRGVTVTW